MAAPKKNAKGLWVAKVRRYRLDEDTGKSKPYFEGQKTYKSFKDAKKWVKDKEIELDKVQEALKRRKKQGIALPAPVDTKGHDFVEAANRGFTVADAVKFHIAEVKKDSNRKAGITTNHETVFAWWEATLGSETEISELKSIYFLTAQTELMQTVKSNGDLLSVATVNRRVAMISAVMTTCVKAQLIEINPARGVTTLTEDKGRDRILTDVELKRLTQTCLASDEPALYPFVIMGIHTGARAGELQSLTWDDIDWKKGAALLTNTKNGDDRLIPVQGRAKEVLVDRYLQPLEGSEDVFWNKNGVTPFTYSRAFRLACNEAKITDFHFHDLRHNFASRLSNGQQINQLTLSAMLGHRSMQMTKRYTHIFDDKVAEIGAEFAAKLDL